MKILTLDSVYEQMGDLVEMTIRYRKALDEIAMPDKTGFDIDHLTEADAAELVRIARRALT